MTEVMPPPDKRFRCLHQGRRSCGLRNSLQIMRTLPIVGWKLSFGIFDALARGNADMTYYFMPFSRKWSMSRIYLTYVWIAVAAGTLVLILVGLGIMGNEDGPGFILNMLAFLSAFVMGAYCLVLLYTNRKLLPKKIRPRALSTFALCLGALIYLGGLFVSLAVFGALPD
ncbi:MAG: Nramp family divalent metal transporter [Actinomycetota bacterium]